MGNSDRTFKFYHGNNFVVPIFKNFTPFIYCSMALLRDHTYEVLYKNSTLADLRESLSPKQFNQSQLSLIAW